MAKQPTIPVEEVIRVANQMGLGNAHVPSVEDAEDGYWCIHIEVSDKDLDRGRMLADPDAHKFNSRVYTLEFGPKSYSHDKGYFIGWEEDGYTSREPVEGETPGIRWHAFRAHCLSSSNFGARNPWEILYQIALDQAQVKAKIEAMEAMKALGFDIKVRATP